jgi:uncharacterized protein
MTEGLSRKLADLDRVIGSMQRVAVAVSGGVDSLTLAHTAHRKLGSNAAMFHALSPAVPPEATERTRRFARDFGWRLEVIDASEFADRDYVRNPANRCFFCKSNLYGTIAQNTDALILSGTNLDDLADVRPGLDAARNHGVRHPFVEAGIDKASVRTIAARLELHDIADLPASPCLSSRVETGIPITAAALAVVHAVEQLVGRRLTAATVRCRIRAGGLYIELDAAAYRRATAEPDVDLLSAIEKLCAERGYAGPVQFALYRMGSAFLRN